MLTIRKAQIQRLQSDGRPAGKALKVQYNPGEYTLTKASTFAEVPIPGLDSPIVQFVRGQSETLALDLFFDSTEKGTGTTADPVTKYTDEFYQLVKIEGGTHAPPVLLFSWGEETFPGHRGYSTLGGQGRHGFKCVLESVKQRFTFFSPNGVPLRAVLSVQFKEYKTLSDQIAELKLKSADHTKTHVVERKDTLPRIAWKAYGDPEDWRLIAEHNGIYDPMQLRTGAVLEIPRKV
jgi:nucleoid-associated protein YgaU